MSTTPDTHLKDFITALNQLEAYQLLDAAKLVIKQLDDTQHRQFREWHILEPERRKEAQAREQAAAEVVTDLINTGAISGAESTTLEHLIEDDKASIPEWVNPGTDHARMYLQGAVVAHAGKVWVSTHAGLNHWEPGALQGDGRIWSIVDVEALKPPEEPRPGDEQGRDVPSVPEGEELPAEPDDELAVDDFKQPTGAHDVYPKGALVRFQGQVYESLIPNNAHSPAAYPAGWELVEDWPS